MNIEHRIEDYRRLPLPRLLELALTAKLAHRGDSFSLCSIINAKSGRCGEDCRFCAQSAHYRTAAPVYPLRDREEIVAAAMEAKRNRAGHFSIVTSGRGLGEAEIDKVAATIREIVARVDIKVCASLGILTPSQLRLLKEAGLSRYHHNLETSREFFPHMVTTHTFEERIETIRAAREAGLEVCAGGILGLGENEEDRLSMAMTLLECGVVSVPLNILIPLPGTPVEHNPPLTAVEILRAIALYRLIFKELPIRLAAGRGEPGMRDFLATAFMAGADGLMIGGYLTQGCRPPEEDHRFVDEMQTLWRASAAGG